MKHSPIKHPTLTGLAVLFTSLTVQGAEPKSGPDTPAAEKTHPAGQWRSEPPADWAGDMIRRMVQTQYQHRYQRRRESNHSGIPTDSAEDSTQSM